MAHRAANTSVFDVRSRERRGYQVDDNVDDRPSVPIMLAQPPYYGFDHCRICGKKLPSENRPFFKGWEDAQKYPLMVEAEWRAKGFLAAPTWHQHHDNAADGCCTDCGLRILRKTDRLPSVALLMAILITAGLALLFWVMAYAR